MIFWIKIPEQLILTIGQTTLRRISPKNVMNISWNSSEEKKDLEIFPVCDLDAILRH